MPCLYDSCICTFQSFNALKIHLSRFHNDKDRIGAGEGAQAARVVFTCPLCGLKQPFSEAILFSHLRGHLKNREMVECPFKNCNYSTNVYSSFNAHKSRTHPVSSDFCDGIVSTDDDSAPVISNADLDNEGPTQCQSAYTFDVPEAES